MDNSTQRNRPTEHILMRLSTIGGATLLLAGSLTAVHAAPKDDVNNAAKALGEKDNYSWTTTVEVPADARWRPGPTQGKTEKGGFTHYNMSFFDNPVDVVCKGDKRAFTNQDGDWQTAAEAENEEGPGRFMAAFVGNLQTPSEQATQLASFVDELKKEEDAYVGDLTEKGATTLVSFRRDANDSSVSDASGSVKFWLKDGALTKYEFKVKGTVDWNGNAFDNERTTTVEIKEVGSTKVEVPEGAKQKLS